MTESQSNQYPECLAIGESCDICLQLARIAFACQLSGMLSGKDFDTALGVAERSGLSALVSRRGIDVLGCAERRNLAVRIGEVHAERFRE